MVSASEVIGEDSRYLMQSFSRWYPLVIDHAEGSLVYDVEGREYIDMNAGIGVMALGHRNRKVLNAIQTQMEKFLHYSLTDFYYDLAVRVAKKISALFPWTGKVFYTNSGTESVEASIKVARGHTGRQYVLGFVNSFHGRTFGSMTFTSSKSVQRSMFSPLLPSTLLLPYPDHHNPLCKEECAQEILSFLEDWVLRKVVDPNDVAAVLLEPIQGEGGVVIPPKDFLRGLRSLTRKHEILMILDEVQTGIGRTGKMFAFEHFGVDPDLVCLAKALGGGLPLGAVIGRAELMDLPRGSHANTFGGNPLALAAAEVVLEEVPKLLTHVNEVGKVVVETLNEARSPYLEEVRGMGLMIGADLRRGTQPHEEGLNKVLLNSFKRGVLAIGAGESVVRLLPPLVIQEELATKATKVIKEEIEQI